MSAPGLLARLAESLFWIGRYVERADDTARIVDAYLHRLLEDPFEDENLACRSLLATMGLHVPAKEIARTDFVIEALAFDSNGASAIVGALRCAHENALGSRDVISSEMWECLNTTWFEIPAKLAQSRRVGPHVFLRSVRERAALFAGLADATMSRDDAWRFMSLGRNIERVDMTTRLLSVRVLAGGHAPDWPTLLRAAGAEEAFLQTHVGVDDPQKIAAFLLLDRRFPRSALYALKSVEGELVDLEPDRIRSGIQGDAQRIIGQVRTQLEYTDITHFMPNLPSIIESISQACAEASASISTRFFNSSNSVRWEAE